MAQHPAQAQPDFRAIIKEEIASQNKALIETLRKELSINPETLASALQEALKAHTPVIANLTATLAAEKVVLLQAGSIQQLQAQNDIFSNKLAEMVSARGTKTKKAAETPALETAPAGTDAPKPAPIKTPAAPKTVGTFSNRLLFFKYLAENASPIYASITNEALVSAAKETPEYKQCVSSKKLDNPAGVKACAAMEATQIYKVISKNSTYEAQMKALSDAMIAHNASLSAPPKIETAEKIE